MRRSLLLSVSLSRRIPPRSNRRKKERESGLLKELLPSSRFGLSDERSVTVNVAATRNPSLDVFAVTPHPAKIKQEKKRKGVWFLKELLPSSPSPVWS
jgi:hypothetical protein